MNEYKESCSKGNKNKNKWRNKLFYRKATKRINLNNFNFGNQR